MVFEVKEYSYSTGSFVPLYIILEKIIEIFNP